MGKSNLSGKGDIGIREYAPIAGVSVVKPRFITRSSGLQRYTLYRIPYTLYRIPSYTQIPLGRAGIFAIFGLRSEPA